MENRREMFMRDLQQYTKNNPNQRNYGQRSVNENRNRQNNNHKNIKSARTWVGKHKKAVAISLATLIAAAGIGIGVGVHNTQRDQKLRRDIQSELYDKSMNLEDARVKWDGEKFVAELDCERSQLYDLLEKNDFDEIMTELNSAKNDIDKEIAYNKLKGREIEFTNFIFNSAKALFLTKDANNGATDFKDVRLTYDNVNGVEDLKATVGLMTAENYSYQNKWNKQIPNEYANPLKIATMNQILANNNNKPDLQELIDNYNEIKLLMIKCLDNNTRLTIEQNGENKKVVAENIEKINEDRQNEDEERG